MLAKIIRSTGMPRIAEVEHFKTKSGKKIKGSFVLRYPKGNRELFIANERIAYECISEKIVIVMVDVRLLLSTAKQCLFDFCKVKDEKEFRQKVNERKIILTHP